MTTQTQKPKGIFPSIPRSTQAVDAKGHLTPQWALSLNNIYEALQQNFTNEGFALPILSQADQDTIEQVYQKYVTKTLPAGVKDITGYMIMDAPHYGGGSPARVPKVFVIEYNSDRTVSSAGWKTYTIT